MTTAVQLVKRLRARIDAMAPDSPELRTAMTKIGTLVTAQARLNVRQQRLIDTGRLINSIRWQYFKRGSTVGVQIGSFGVKYAAVHEFGFRGVVTVREHQRRTALGGLAPVRTHSRRMSVRKRPYLVPAIKRHRQTIVDLIASALGAPKGA